MVLESAHSTLRVPHMNLNPRYKCARVFSALLPGRHDSYDHNYNTCPDALVAARYCAEKGPVVAAGA